MRWLTPRYATTLQPAEAGFVCVDAVSTAGVFGLMADGIFGLMGDRI
ncbi:hypothetical protein QUB19_11095 [Microcoleus sp. B4-C5]